MPWLQAHLIVPAEQSQAIEEAFEQLGALSITLGDARDEPVLETLPDEIRLWSLVKITGLFEATTDSDHIRQHINQSFAQDLSQQLQVDILQDQQWERRWLEHFKPMKFGQRLWVCPSGLTVNEDNAVVIDLDPGLAFGTGTHPTTALCLEWLDRQDMTDKKIIDYGCGSGILAIAALKLGAAQTTGIDYDPQALLASQNNAEKNNVADRLELDNIDTVPAYQADILLANILAGVLIELSDKLAELTRPGGTIVLSGILKEQAQQVIEKYEKCFNMGPLREVDGWIRLEGTRIK